MEALPLAANKKKARAEGRTIVFVDESGLSQRPHVTRTWAPRGQTPVIKHSGSWKNLSAAAGVTVEQFYFRLYPGAIRAEQIIHFLGQLQRQIQGSLLVVWDNLPAHRSRAVKDWVAAQKGRIWVERLPAYAPELNPVEYVWSYWKTHVMRNFCPRTEEELHFYARCGLRKVQAKRTLVSAFWQQAQLPI